MCTASGPFASGCPADCTPFAAFGSLTTVDGVDPGFCAGTYGDFTVTE
jgi:hypothetical protein